MWESELDVHALKGAQHALTRYLIGRVKRASPPDQYGLSTALRRRVLRIAQHAMARPSKVGIPAPHASGLVYTAKR